MRTKDARTTGRRRPYEPTASDIRRACERIQDHWSARERSKRAGHGHDDSWQPPSVDWTTVTDAISESQGDIPQVNTRSDGGW